MHIFNLSNDTHLHTIVLWGSGLIGCSIQNALEKTRNIRAIQQPNNWQDIDKLRLQHRELHQFILENLRVVNRHRIDLIWAAGSAGFSCNDQNANAELRNFQVILELAERLNDHSQSDLEFHLISSAGGIYEGCRAIHAETTPTAKRIYGKLKLTQETLLQNTALNFQVYRPSSVYGYYHSANRPSFLSQLVKNTLTNQETRITGTPNTLRDFIWVNDVASFIVEQVKLPSNRLQRQVHLLATGRPTSLSEAIEIVEETLRRPVRVLFCQTPDNQADITFSQRAIPTQLRVTPVKQGVQMIYRRLQPGCPEKPA